MLSQQAKADLACAYEDAIVDTLIEKSRRAIQYAKVNSIVIAGGVGANKKLREKMKDIFSKKDIDVIYPSIEYCTDNAAMIALTGLYNLKEGISNKSYEINVNPRWSIDNIYNSHG